MLMPAAKAAHVAVDGQQSALALRYVKSSKYDKLDLCFKIMLDQCHAHSISAAPGCSLTTA
jgi:hypothetical protein